MDSQEHIKTFIKQATPFELEIYQTLNGIAKGYNQKFTRLQLPVAIRIDKITHKLTLPHYEGETFNVKWDESNGGLDMGLELAKEIPEVIKDLSIIDSKIITGNSELMSAPKCVFDHQEALIYYGDIASKFLSDGLIDESTFSDIMKLLRYEQLTRRIVSNGDFYARNFIRLPDKKLVLIDWEPWGERTSPFYIVDHPENVAAVFYAHMWGNPGWREVYLGALQDLFDLDMQSFKKGIIIKTLGLADFWYDERGENNLALDQLKLLTETLGL